MKAKCLLPWMVVAALLAASCGGSSSPESETAPMVPSAMNEASASDAQVDTKSPPATSPMATGPAAMGGTPATGSAAAVGGMTSVAGAAAGGGAVAVATPSDTTQGAPGGSGGASGAAASLPSAGSSGSGVSTSGPAPKLPEITGECPAFATGDWSFSGLTGVMEAGEKSAGTAPLLFYWAGTDFPASAYTQVGDNNVKRVTSEGGVIVSIQGSAEHALDTDCSITGYYSHEFEPIGQIAACAVRDYGIDRRRIYATGCSAGGVTSGCLATRASSYIAAVATNSGGLTSVEKLVDPSHVPPVMTMHGGAADFGGLFTTDSRNLNMAIKDAGGFAVNCDHGGGHCAASPELQNAAFEFLWAHPFGVDPEPYASGLPMSFPSFCEIY
jgi:dienelactone hydrolase